ncbi:hypothetical protein ABNK34_003865 [Klebsiella pneumoniae]|uniref:hypothetical protein n=1 Tax=Klebsiella pneumoniae TaxID=573 RepID=UPI0018C69C36|nr:hypothetical protein [Klebsiella pneumoniae]HDS7912965.1 hypothetical protein [Klebsiella pneumoniae subsp. pneumoniae]ELA2263231.1 hypothetical protein [Klebsiella pneumoniae]ELB3904480.1 hypothetical protein [Klebsiella pneumoniae]ELB4122100.1 hypothetical protein [Klebsiella pneumoniae]ELB4424617.1 hypothetical protein [Klebsiella pneumoniae]
MNIETVNELIASLESADELSIREQKFLKLAKEFRICSASLDAAIKTGNMLADQNAQLAAENVALKSAVTKQIELRSEIKKAGRPPHADFWVQSICEAEDRVSKALNGTTDTDRIVAGIKADGRAEGINFAASRLAAAFNHGFVDKPMAEVGDVVRMILDAKADLANSQIPAEDGLSGEYAEKSLAEWEAALSDGADK